MITKRKAIKFDGTLKGAYYAHFSSQRYSRRYSSFKFHLKAQRLHLRLQRKESGISTGKASNWCHVVAKHKKKFNKPHQELEKQQKIRDYRNQELKQQEIKTEAIKLIANWLENV